MTTLKKHTLLFIFSLLMLVTGVIFTGIMLFNIAGLQSWFWAHVGIMFNNALCVALTGAYYLLVPFRQHKKMAILRWFLSCSVIVVCAITLAEYTFNINPGIDQLFATDKNGLANNNPHPGRMMPQTALVFFLFGLAMLGFSTSSKRLYIVSQYLLHLVSLIVAVLLIGFLYSGSFLYNLKTYSFNYLYEGLLVFGMSICATFLYPSLGITGLFSGQLVGNKMARRLFVLMAALILVLGIIKTGFIDFKLWELDTTQSLFIASALFIGLMLIWYIASWLNRVDLERYDAEKKLKTLNEQLEKRVDERTTELHALVEKLKESELLFRTLAEKSMVGVYIGRSERFSYVNPRFAEIFGYSPGELMNTVESTVQMLISAEGRRTVSENILARQRGEVESAHYEVRGKKKDGSDNYVEFFGNSVVIEGQSSIIGTMLDITERKKAEVELRLSEQKYKLLFESNPQPLWMIARDDLSIISVNGAAARLYGYTVDELLHKNITIVRPAEDWGQLQENFQKEFSTSAEVGLARHVKKDGTLMFVRIIANDILFEGKRVRLALTTDVTEKIIADKKLQESESNLRTILDTTGIAYVLIDKALAIMAFNQKAAQFIHMLFSTHLQVTCKLAELLPVDRVPQFFAHANDVLSGNIISYETNYSHTDGSVFYFSVRMFPLKNEANEIFGMMLELSDITAIKKYTNAVEEQNRKFREIAWLQSHVVRAPLARMMGIINLIQDNNLAAEEQHEFLQYLSSSANELDVIIKDITDRTVAIR